MPVAGSPTHLWRRIFFWTMLPISGLQGLWLRRSAMRLDPPAGEIRGGCGTGQNLYLLALGDSIIAGVGADTQEQTLPMQFAQVLAAGLQCRVEWHIEGKNGANLAMLLAQIQSLEPASPADIILLSIGVNDVTGLSTTRRWRQQLEHLVALIRARWPQALVVFAGLPPMSQFPLPPQPLRFSLGLRAGTFDRIASNMLASQQGMLHIATEINPQEHGFCEDGFHPSAESYAIWGKELAAQVAETGSEYIFPRPLGHLPIPHGKMYSDPSRSYQSP
jgi:lysophospholipase L1-like esterase